MRFCGSQATDLMLFLSVTTKFFIFGCFASLHLLCSLPRMDMRRYLKNRVEHAEKFASDVVMKNVSKLHQNLHSKTENSTFSTGFPAKLFEDNGSAVR